MQDERSQGGKAVPQICFQANYKIPTPSLLVWAKSFPSHTMTGKVVGWHWLPFSDTFLSVLSIRKASEPQSRLCTKALLCGRCSPVESLTNPYISLSLCGQSAMQYKSTTEANGQSTKFLHPHSWFWCLSTGRTWDHLPLADRWPRSQHSTFAPAQLASSPGRPGHTLLGDIAHMIPSTQPQS